jgi:hypothetical protein
MQAYVLASNDGEVLCDMFTAIVMAYYLYYYSVFGRCRGGAKMISTWIRYDGIRPLYYYYYFLSFPSVGFWRNGRPLCMKDFLLEFFWPPFLLKI